VSNSINSVNQPDNNDNGSQENQKQEQTAGIEKPPLSGVTDASLSGGPIGSPDENPVPAPSPVHINPHSGDPYRPPRARPRQRDGSRGVPPREDLIKLARAYLTQQRILWPVAVQAGLLPAPDDTSALEQMADEFVRRHASGQIADDVLGRYVRYFQRLAAAYLRYSCDNSNPRSLDDQLSNVLKKAAGENLFTPWELVFADASISGMDAGRQGYGSLKHVLQNVAMTKVIDAVIIDEFSRASRDTLEWFRLAGLCKRLSKNVLGASDNFVLNTLMGEMMLHVFGMFSRFFITQLRDKVLRGMKGAARRATSVGRPRLGYGLVTAKDATGAPMIGADGRVIKEKAIHKPTMQYVMLAADWYANRRESYAAIAKEFSRLKVDGSSGWRPASIKGLLADPIFIGVDIFNQTRNEYDAESHKRQTIRNHHRQWEVTQEQHAQKERALEHAPRRRKFYRPGWA
jgi:DNA invertase Pin-like site-specific DNA recombinase